ncbi:MAG: hypothetical protein NTV63_01145 [Candidatus Woesearchaeota archaeon]|nr:hypothetical protein [Candidatus Woesearchaeota archaeon]
MEKYIGLLNNEMSLDSEPRISPVFMDVTGLVEKNPELTVYQLMADILEQDGLDRKERDILDTTKRFIQIFKSWNGLGVQTLSLRNFDIIKPSLESTFSFREFDAGEFKTTFIDDYLNAHALPLFEDAEFIDPITEKIVKYKGLYLVASENPWERQ